MTDHELVEALKRCEGDLGAVLEELRVRGAPDDAAAAQELDDAREVVERWRRRMIEGGWEGRSVAAYPPSTKQ